MATLNRVTMIGRLTDNPEPPRVLPNSGAAVVKFRFAVSKPSKKDPQSGQWINDPNPLYIDCEAFTQADARFRLTDIISQYLTKGKLVYIEGRLQLDTWDDKNNPGQKRSKHKIVVDSVQMLDGGGQGQQSGGQQQKPQQQYGGNYGQQPQDHGNFQQPSTQPGDSDIPF